MFTPNKKETQDPTHNFHQQQHTHQYQNHPTSASSSRSNAHDPTQTPVTCLLRDRIAEKSVKCQHRQSLRPKIPQQIASSSSTLLSFPLKIDTMNIFISYLFKILNFESNQIHPFSSSKIIPILIYLRTFFSLCLERGVLGEIFESCNFILMNII